MKQRTGQKNRPTGERTSPGAGDAALRRVLIGAFGLAMGLGGCGGPKQALAPNSPVYVDTKVLAQRRPEWKSVQQLDGQIAGLQAFLRAGGVSRAAPPALAPATTEQPAKPAAPVLQPHTAAGDALIARSAPSPEDLRKELTAEASGALSLFERKVDARYEPEREARRLETTNRYADNRTAILARHREKILADITHIMPRQHWLDVTPPPVVRTAATTEAVDRVSTDIHETASLLAQELAQQRAELLANHAALERELAALANAYEKREAADMKTQTDQSNERIAGLVRNAVADATQEAAARAQIFDQAFINPLATPMPEAAPPVLQVRPAAQPSVGPGAAPAIRAEIAAVSAERNEIANSIVTDTQNWVKGIADRAHWNLVDRRTRSIPDETALFESRMRQEAITALGAPAILSVPSPR